jgi:hypothetical protein
VSVDIEQVYEEHVRALSLADQLRLAALIVTKAAVRMETTSLVVPAVVVRPPDPS